MAHRGRLLVGAQLKVVHSPGKVERTLQLVSHLISRNLAPDMGLTPMHPGASHFERIIPDVGRPRPAADAVSGFDEEDSKAWRKVRKLPYPAGWQDVCMYPQDMRHDKP